MKKLISIAVVAVMALCLACSAFAATSVSGVVTAATEGGAALTIDRAATTLPSTTAISTDALASVKVSNAATLAVWDSFDLALNGEIDATNGTVIRFALTLKPDANTRVMHQKADKSWEDVTSGYSDAAGSYWVEGKFTSLSPVAIVEVSTTSSTSSSTTTAATSPKTGFADFSGLAMAALVAAGSGAVLVSRKKHD